MRKDEAHGSPSEHEPFPSSQSSENGSRPRKEKRGVRLLAELVRFNFGKLVLLNMIFVVACLPLVTLPCALAGMSRVLGLIIERRPFFIFYDFRTAFVSEWKRASAAGWSVIGLVALAVAAYVMYLRGGVPGGSLLAGVCVILVVFFVAVGSYVFPLVVRTDLGVKDVLKNSLLLVQLRLPYTVLSLLLSLAILLVCFAFLPFTALLLPLIGFSLIGLVQVYNAMEGITQYVARKEGE
ncbi:MAG: DUF624 domain-containing protein [Bifidobacteriaceae bacterium]|jgi:uncharacterized membrane protein YesL|nr:DUF624 domain-containing protein [Bifidobacteriaceae bacterium]